MHIRSDPNGDEKRCGTYFTEPSINWQPHRKSRSSCWPGQPITCTGHSIVCNLQRSQRYISALQHLLNEDMQFSLMGTSLPVFCWCGCQPVLIAQRANNGNRLKFS